MNRTQNFAPVNIIPAIIWIWLDWWCQSSLFWVENPDKRTDQWIRTWKH